ncbi:acyltransferase [Nonomuraea sp. NPDC049695]|uniref:acyltransferase family protein n=1 Tax=Nonomuraea sp. NPDC049695 TaxID=3154734 RepID=UPI00342EB643
MKSAEMLQTATVERRRLAGLDGIRGLAALFVVFHHVWLLSFPGFPRDTGPGWASWMVYGHFAVVVFIVLSGFSLALSPARNGWRLDSLGTFAYRRAWRILPPYWAAVALSLVIAWTLVPQPEQGVPTGKSVLIYGLLLQDVFGSPSPNGALWSIAVEAQLYFVFPLLLLILRRMGAIVMVGAVTAVVAAVGLLAQVVPVVGELMRLTPQFAALFALGMAGAGVVRLQRRVPFQWLAAAALLPVLALIVIKGSVWTIGNLYWIDLAIGPAIVLLLAAVATGKPAPVVWLLDTGPVKSLGSFSYSLYLIHAPIVVNIHALVVAPRMEQGVPAFLVSLVLAVPVTVVAARLFAGVFELPFTRNRTPAALRAAVRARLARARTQ